ncbi:GTP-binding protein Rheb-like [Acanthaster planci]|uniref:GTP-binding protein Rheb-like n=1 Tax=Acanthaster planci TaxID=133434 RepID=A0A8B7Y5J7_ACAPL|nr:GTP-binding protein Rheb-like [Acanthaster planci]
MPPPQKDRCIAVMGFRSVGKSSLTIQFVENQFVDAYDPTIENTFEKMIKLGNQEYKLKIVDTAGQDEYSIFPQSLTFTIHGYVLVYTVTSQKSFDVVKIIHEKLLDTTGNVNVPVVLVGNKKDLHMERVISTAEGKELANSWNANFIESSAKQNESVVDIFKTLLEIIEKKDGGTQKKDSECVLL